MATDFRLKERLPELTDRIVSTYAEVNSIHHPRPLPAAQLRQDHHRHGRPQGGSLPRLSPPRSPAPGQRHLLRGRPDRQPPRHADHADRPALCHEWAASPDAALRTRDDFEALGQAKTLAFLEQLPTLRKILALDVQAAYDGDPACKSLDEVIFCYPGLEAITVYRLAHLLHQLQVPLIPRMMTEWAHSRTGIDIHPGATMGKYFFIDHGTGVVIGETCTIGDWVKLYQGVTLGALSFATDPEGGLVRGTKRHPTIEDHVVIYANATILGGQTVIGHDSVIGSSAWVTRSVEPHTTVTLEKPRLRMRGEAKDLEGEEPLVWEISNQCPDYSRSNTSPKRKRGTDNELPSLARRASVEQAASE